jgi:hypothetical protein
MIGRKKKVDKVLVKSLDKNDIEYIQMKIMSFERKACDDFYIDRESLVVNIYNDGSMEIRGDFKTTEVEKI